MSKTSTFVYSREPGGKQNNEAQEQGHVDCYDVYCRNADYRAMMYGEQGRTYELL